LLTREPQNEGALSAKNGQCLLTVGKKALERGLKPSSWKDFSQTGAPKGRENGEMGLGRVKCRQRKGGSREKGRMPKTRGCKERKKKGVSKER